MDSKQVSATELAKKARARALRMVSAARASHIGTCLSMADILAVLYADVMNFRATEPTWQTRDRFILSKGHGAAILYAVLAECGFFDVDQLNGFCTDGSLLQGHASHLVPGVEVSTGSLGHGLPIGVGIALAGKRENAEYRTIVLTGDGELDEGSNWEALLFASAHQLDGLTVIVDRNCMQGLGFCEAIISLEPLAAKLSAFGCEVETVDGHDTSALQGALCRSRGGRPKAVIANTVKGKGVSFMEHRLEWHYRSPNAQELEAALRELQDAP